MFELIPCVDIQGGRAVRLLAGDPDKETVYFDKPLEAALHWASLGCRWLHLVDLDAATGRGDNGAAIAEIAREVACKLELGGGVRDFETAARWLESVDRVVIGTAAITAPELLDALLADFGPERLVVSVDARAGRVAVKGWAELSAVTATELARRVAAQGVRQLIYTDVARDGTLQGVDPGPVREMRAAFPHSLVAGGGVGSDEDLALYQDLGLDGAIVGKALYEGRIRYPRTA